MKKVLLFLLLTGLPALVPQVRAQVSPPAVEYSEQVAVDGAGRARLYGQALEWVGQNFKDKTGMSALPAAGIIRLTGTGTVKPIDSKGKDQPLTVLFTFSFTATDNGYTYRINSFRIMPDPDEPTQLVDFDGYCNQIRAERTDSKTHNARRITAQANSLASGLALSFRSFMNSQPAEEHVGIGGQ